MTISRILSLLVNLTAMIPVLGYFAVGIRAIHADVFTGIVEIAVALGFFFIYRFTFYGLHGGEALEGIE